MSTCLTKMHPKITSIENARNLFQNGASYDLVRASITHLTDEELQAIYNEVTGTDYNK